jgi:hypothetical protein
VNLIAYCGGFGVIDLLVKSLNGRLYINSVRIYQIAGKRLTVVHLGTGQIHELPDGKTDPPGKEYTPEFSFQTIDDSIFIEPVLHHGHGFDFYIWE